MLKIQQVQINTEPLVSVCTITYQHVKYIKDTLDGIIAQKTDFTFELCLGEDGSTDGTREICENYARKYPEIIRLFIRDRNCPERRHYKQPTAYNGLKTLEACRGKYIALCEGDDYWTDPFKLQKQVDYLEANPDCSFCFTDCQIERKKRLQEIHPNINKKIKLDGIEFADQSGSIAQTCTWLVKRECLQNLPKWVTRSYTGDWCMQVYFSKFGKGGYIPKKTAVYRIHDKGVWSKLSPFEGWRKNLAFYKTALRQLTDTSSNKRLQKRIQKTVIEALELSNIHANKSEIRKWLWQKLITCPFVSRKQTLHSLRLLLS